jgi:protein involved in polysaccharide export with SLBB domain
VDEALLADPGTATRNEGVAEHYPVGCPDVLELGVAGRPDLTGPRTIGADGEIDLGVAGSVRVQGRTPGEAAAAVAAVLRLPPARVRVRVAEFRSRQLYLSGPGVGVPRTVAYQGQETVLDLLQRVGGITRTAAPEEVYVVRPHVTEGERPEVFHVDLQAILLKKDARTNVRLQPFDQVYVGETRQGKVNKCLPPLLQPVYQALWGIGPRPRTGQAAAPGRRDEVVSG